MNKSNDCAKTAIINDGSDKASDRASNDLTSEDWGWPRTTSYLFISRETQLPRDFKQSNSGRI